MSKGGGSETTVAEPWAGAQPYISKGYQEASGIYDRFSPSYYGGTTQAGFSPDELTSQAGVRDWATKGAPNVMNPALSAYQYGTGTGVVDVAKNPYVKDMAAQASKDAYAQLNPALAGIRGSAIQSGGYGGGRQGIAEGTAIAGAADAANAASAGIYSDAYGKGLQHQSSTLGQTGGIVNAGFSPYAALGASGEAQSGREQRLIEDAKAQHEFSQNLPYNRLNQYTGAISGTSGLLGNSGIKTSPGMSTLGQVGQLASIYAMTQMSDSRLKTNINKIGELPSGLGIYTWKWIEGAVKLGADAGHTTGVIAQEVKKIIPEAVTKFADGYYRVDYSKVI